MEFDIDCRGLACPGPVIKTKERLSEDTGAFTVLVDNEAARRNVERFAGGLDCEVESYETKAGYIVSVTPLKTAAGTDSKPVAAEIELERQTVLFFASDVLGSGDRELGEALARAFLYACAENDNRPSRMVFMNSGVRLVTENEEAAGHVKELADDGVEVLVCGTCLDFYGLKDRLLVGRVSNMYEIQAVLIGADHLVSV